jgi:hypothetical protein
VILSLADAGKFRLCDFQGLVNMKCDETAKQADGKWRARLGSFTGAAGAAAAAHHFSAMYSARSAASADSRYREGGGAPWLRHLIGEAIHAYVVSGTLAPRYFATQPSAVHTTVTLVFVLPSGEVTTITLVSPYLAVWPPSSSEHPESSFPFGTMTSPLGICADAARLALIGAITNSALHKAGHSLWNIAVCSAFPAGLFIAHSLRFRFMSPRATNIIY